MKIFITWSGARSKAVAQAVRKWIKSSLQATQPFISDRDIRRGARWREALRKELADTDNGIVCVTNANQEAPWLLYEAGAISKPENGHVCTLLIDLNPADVRDPLGQFQHTLLTEESLREMLKDFNRRLPDGVKLDDETFNSSFDSNWPRFWSDIQAVIKAPEIGEALPKRQDREILEEILVTVRDISKTQAVNPEPPTLNSAIAELLRRHESLQIAPRDADGMARAVEALREGRPIIGKPIDPP
jgi:hypothetical protein